jgi:hypothetical protein
MAEGVIDRRKERGFNRCPGTGRELSGMRPRGILIGQH